MKIQLAYCTDTDQSNGWLSNSKNPTDNKLILGGFDGQSSEFHLEASKPEIQLSEFKGEIKQDSRENYLRKLDLLISTLKETELSKVVLSRRKFIPLDSITCKKLATTTPRPIAKKLHYKLYNSQQGTYWLGASPEKILHKKGSSCTTHALAGTASSANAFSNKEYEEQGFVSEYIVNALNCPVQMSEVTAVQHGKLFHLFNQIQWQDHRSTMEIIASLHPTPAVCGIPLEQSRNFIRNHESSERLLYTGFIGIENKEESNIYVNLRSGQLFNNGLVLYAGGGITALSDPEAEYKETEIKMEAILADLLDAP